MNTQRLHLFCVIVTLALASPAAAATFNGTHADITDFVNGTEVSTRGVLIDAINLSNNCCDGLSTGDVTINSVTFKGVAPGQFHEAGEDFANASFVYHGGEGYRDDNLWTSGGSYDVLADSQLYNIDNGNVNYGDGYGVVNLTPGTRYELQIFMLDDRSGIDKNFPLQFQQVTFTGSADGFIPYDPAPDELGYMDGITTGGAGVTQANGEIATIRFSIDEGFNGIFVNTWNGGAFNGMQLRLIGTPGDYNGDTVVDDVDFNVWKNDFGSTSQLAADGNGDGVVDAADYTVWRDNATSSGGGSLVATGVPEPGATLLAMTCLTLGAAACRMRGDRWRRAITL